jgi:outer membrane protein
MKNISLVLNVVLLIAVVILYIKVYSENEPQPVVVSGADASKAAIVYVHSDSLLDNYPLLKTLEDAFNKKRDSIDRILSARDKSLKQEFAVFEKQAATMPEEQQQREYESFMRKQQDLVDFRDNLLKTLGEEQEQLQDSVHNNLVRTLRDYNKSHGYQYILSYQRGSGILFADDSLNITKEVMNRLNVNK